MSWIEDVQKAIDYIENNLTGEIDFNVVAMKACCSSYNFQRMFSFITDIPLAEYITMHQSQSLSQCVKTMDQN